MLSDRPSRFASGGFSLIELLFALVVVSVLALVALPSFESHIHRARRTDALVAALQVQTAQERFRTQAPSYGSLADIGAAGRSAAGHYRLELVASDADGYELLLAATGLQARDTACRFMKLTSIGLDVVQASGPDASVANDAVRNRQCWGLR